MVPCGILEQKDLLLDLVYNSWKLLHVGVDPKRLTTHLSQNNILQFYDDASQEFIM